jgi:membrane protease YdiL (CAAX protease family)
MALILFVFRDKPGQYGFGLGGILLMAPILWFLNRADASMRSYYDPFVEYLPWSTFLDLLGWEFLFRGWILFGYARIFGPEALWLQAVPFAMAHIGKPTIETFSTIFGGFAFGWIAYRTRSFIYPLLIHWFIASFAIVVAAGALG